MIGVVFLYLINDNVQQILRRTCSEAVRIGSDFLITKVRTIIMQFFLGKCLFFHASLNTELAFHLRKMVLVKCLSLFLNPNAKLQNTQRDRLSVYKNPN